MTRFDFVLAHDFDRAWLNFELDLPLQPGPKGQPNPFYVERQGNPIAELTDALLAPFNFPPKFYFSGHRGCGKSTELLHILSNPEIQRKFWPINFSIREEADIVDLDFRDVLLAIGGRMFREYRKAGGELPGQLLKDLNSWRGRIEEEVRTILAGRNHENEVDASIDAFFVNAGLKMKLEPATRIELRQIFEKDITGLITVINSISEAIYAREKRTHVFRRNRCLRAYGKLLPEPCDHFRKASMVQQPTTNQSEPTVVALTNVAVIQFPADPH